MLLKSLKRALLLACGVVLFAGLSATADEGKEKTSLSGSWEKKAGETKIVFSDKEVMRVLPHGDKIAIAIVCKYTVEKDGRVKVKVTDLEAPEDVKEKVKNVVPVGLEFNFKYEIKNDTATLDDMKGENIEGIKSHLEGEYEVKK
jgi:hypothetical protein